MTNVSKRNILYIYPKMQPQSQCGGDVLYAGGAQKRIAQMACYFAAQGFHIGLASDDKQSIRLIQELKKKGIMHFSIPFRSGTVKKLLSLVILIRVIKKNRIDLIHCNDRFGSMFGRIASSLTRTKMVYTARSIYDNNRFTGLFFGNNIIAVSEGVKRNLVDYFNVKPSRINIIYNGTDIKHSNSRDLEEARKKYKIHNDTRVISVIGRLTRVKGLEYLLKALPEVIREFPTLRILLVGDGELKSTLQKLCTDLQIQKHVVFCGNQERVENFIDMSEFTVLPSLQEGLGVTAIESIALGKPVIATNIGGLPEVIENRINGLIIQPKNSTALASAAKYMLANPGEVKKMGVRAKEIAEKYFTIEKMFENYFFYYENLNR
jgi:glycosyltransferase involved in cell wall biosynthesis